MRSPKKRLCRGCQAALRPWHWRFCGEECFQAHRLADAARRFWAKVNKNGPVIRPELGPCWLWTGQLSSFNGYGFFGMDGAHQYAHHVAYLLGYGVEYDTEVLRHRCDVRACVRPDHLLPGTQLQNVHDAIERGRLRPINQTAPAIRGVDRCPPERKARGERAGTAVLTEDAVREMRRLYATGSVSQKTLAQQFGIHQTNVSLIVLRKHWTHVA